MATAMEKALVALMKKKGATATPNANTAVAAAHESAMAGDQEEANRLMQESIDMEDPQGEEEAMMKSAKNKAFMEALKKIAKGKKK